MSVQDNKEELRDLVVQCLKAKGVLGKVQAELRATVFLALEDQELFKEKYPVANSRLKEYLKSEDGSLVISLVKEFLEFFNLQFSSIVFDPETLSSIDYKYEGRNNILKNLNFKDDDENLPVIARLVKAFKKGNSSSQTQSSISEQIKGNESHENGTINNEMEKENGLEDHFDSKDHIDKRLNSNKPSQQALLSNLGSLPPLGSSNTKTTDKDLTSDLKILTSFGKDDGPYAEDFLPDTSEKNSKENKVDSISGESEIEEEISSASSNSPQAEETADVSISKSSGQGDYEENVYPSVVSVSKEPDETSGTKQIEPEAPRLLPRRQKAKLNLLDKDYPPIAAAKPSVTTKSTGEKVLVSDDVYIEDFEDPPSSSTDVESSKSIPKNNWYLPQKSTKPHPKSGLPRDLRKEFDELGIKKDYKKSSHDGLAEESLQVGSNKSMSLSDILGFDYHTCDFF